MILESGSFPKSVRPILIFLNTGVIFEARDHRIRDLVFDHVVYKVGVACSCFVAISMFIFGVAVGKPSAAALKLLGSVLGSFCVFVYRCGKTRNMQFCYSEMLVLGDAGRRFLWVNLALHSESSLSSDGSNCFFCLAFPQFCCSLIFIEILTAVAAKTTFS